MKNEEMGTCKHGKFPLMAGCPQCIAERQAATEAVPEPEPEPIIVKVRYISESTGEVISDREYTYFSVEPLNVGNVVQVPMRDRVQKAVVTAIEIPEFEIEKFKDYVKTIPSGSTYPGAQAPPDQAVTLVGKVEDTGTTLQPPLVSTEEPVQEEPPNYGPGGKGANTYGPPPVALQVPEDPPGMGLVEFAPDDELAVRKLFQEGVRLRNFAQARIISTNEDLKPATDDLAIIKKTKTALEEHMGNYVGPIQDHLKQVRTAFGELLAPFNEADQLTRDKVKEFRVIEQKKLALAREEAVAKGGAFTTELQEPVPEHTRTALGTQGFQKVYKWEVTDFAQVPDQYKMIDAGKVGGVVRGSKGTIEIPGIRIWTDETVRINTK